MMGWHWFSAAAQATWASERRRIICILLRITEP
jgi:hypothetical protein